MIKTTNARPGGPAPAASGGNGTKGGATGKWKLKTLTVAVAVVVLLGAGTWFGSTLPDPTTSDAYGQLSQSMAALEANFQKLQGDYNTLDAEHSTLLASIKGREDKVSAREDTATTAEKKVQVAQAAVKKREDAVTGAEATKTKNTVGDGTWTVGRNIDPGTYLSTSDVGASCYWGIYTSGSNGSDIIDNDIPGGGRPTVTLSTGQDFKTARCGTWTKQ